MAFDPRVGQGGQTALGLTPSLTDQHSDVTRPHPLSPTTTPTTSRQSRYTARSRASSNGEHTGRGRVKALGPPSSRGGLRLCKACREGGRASWVLLPWVIHFCPGTRSHLRAAGQRPGLVLKNQNLGLSTCPHRPGDTRPRTLTSRNPSWQSS